MPLMRTGMFRLRKCLACTRRSLRRFTRHDRTPRLRHRDPPAPQPQRSSLLQHSVDAPTRAEISPKVGFGRDALRSLRHTPSQLPRYALGHESLHRLCRGREPTHRRLRHRVVRVRVHVLTRRQRLQRHQAKRGRREFQVADEQPLTLLARPLPFDILQLAVGDCPRAEAAVVRRVTRRVSIDAERAIRRRAWELLTRRQGHPLLLRQLALLRGPWRHQLARPPPQGRRHARRDHHLAAPRAEHRAGRPPRRVQPLPPTREACCCEVELPEQLDELSSSAHALRRHARSKPAVPAPLRVRQDEASPHQIDAHAEQLRHVTRRLLLARLRLMSKARKHALDGVEVQPRSAHLPPVAHERSPRRLVDEIVDARAAAVIDVHRHSVQARPALRQLRLGGSRRQAISSPLRLPRHDSLIRGGMGCIDTLQLTPHLVHQHVGEARALGGIGRAAEAAPPIDDVAALCDSAIAPQLTQLPTEALIVSATVEHAELHGRGRRAQDRRSLRHLMHPHHARRRPIATRHRLVERRHVLTPRSDQRAIACDGAGRRPAVVVGEPAFGVGAHRRAHSLRLIDDGVRVASERPERQLRMRLRPALFN